MSSGHMPTDICYGMTKFPFFQLYFVFACCLLFSFIYYMMGVENDIYTDSESKPRGVGPNLRFVKGVGGPPIKKLSPQ